MKKTNIALYSNTNNADNISLFNKIPTYFSGNTTCNSYGQIFRQEEPQRSCWVYFATSEGNIVKNMHKTTLLEYLNIWDAYVH